MPVAPTVDLRAVQRRTVATLVGTQVMVGVGVSAGAAVGALLAEQLSGSADLAGLGGTFQVLGGALVAIPMAHVMAGRGRRWGMLTGYGLGILGAVTIIVAAAGTFVVNGGGVPNTLPAAPPASSSGCAETNASPFHGA